MMHAGYLSANAYRALKPKIQVNELSLSDCFEFESAICNELKRIFEDDELKCNLFCLENIDESIHLDWDNIHNLLLICFKNFNDVFINIIESIGEKNFVRDYVFCSDDCFKELCNVTNCNLEVLYHVRNQFTVLYKAYLETGTLPESEIQTHEPVRLYSDAMSEDTFIENVPMDKYSTTSERELDQTNNFFIDDDALSSNNTDCKKYVLFLYYLEYNQFNKIKEFLFSLISDCSTRLRNAIIHIGCRKFLVNFLFADDTKILKIRNFGKRSLIELNFLKPQIISFIINEYHCSNTDTVENKLPEENKIINYESLTLREKIGKKQYASLKEMLKTLMSEVSVKTQNDINNYNGDFIEDFIHKSNIKKIRNIEIRFIISKLRKAIQLDNNSRNHETLTIREKIGEGQYASLSNLFKTLLSEASVRTQNGIKNYKGDFIEDFVHKSNDVKKIRNIGKKTEIEFKFIISKLREAINNFKQRELTKDEFFWIEKSSIYENLIDNYCHDYYNEAGRLPMFHILSNCISSLLNVKTIKILDEVVSLFSNKKGLKLDTVAKKYNKSPENIRHICMDAINNLSKMHNPEDSKIYTYHKLISQDMDWAYVSQILSAKIFWKINELEDVLNQEECSINKELAIVALSVIFSDQYSIVGKIPLSISSRSNGWANTYLIPNRLTDSFDFDSMIEVVKDYENSNTKSTTLTIQELVMDTFYRAWKQYDPSIEVDLEQVVAQILVDELGIIPDLDFKYTIEGKKKESIADIIYDLLRASRNPLTMNELFTNINTMSSKGCRSMNSIKYNVDKDPRLCFVGYNREVSLSEWDHIQTGNIRELLVSYLNKYETPRHIDDIVDYILKYRATSRHSVNSTLGNGDQFVKFEDGYYGLSGRTYSKEYLVAETKRCASERLHEFELFLKKNNRFPFCPSNDKEEENLYQWWSRVNRNKNISDTLKQEIIRIESTYSDLVKNKSDYQWLSLCHRYKAFVLANNRQPSGSNPIEVELVKWFSKALNDVTDGKLTPLREREFVKLCKSL